MNAQSTYPEKPALVNIIAWTTLASGIVNLGWGLVISATALLTIVGICCTPLTILPAILGIFEIIYAAKLLSTPPQVVRPATNLAVLEIVCILTGNVFTMVVGILSLIFYNDPAVKNFFARLNADVVSEPVSMAGPQIPAVVPAVTSAPTEEPIPSPITGEQSVVPPAEVEEAPIAEPPVPPATPTATDETIVSSFHREEPPATEPPAAPEEPDPSSKPTEE
jgi:hypothetical protein